MKKFLVGLMLMVASVQAQSYYTTNNLAASNHVVFIQGKVLQEITLFSTNTTPTTVLLRDWPYTSAVSTNSAYTNWTSTTAASVDTYITTTGVTNTYTNTVITYTANPVAASTSNVVRPKLAIVVPASNVPVTYAFNAGNTTFANGLTVSNNAAGLSFVLRYREP